MFVDEQWKGDAGFFAKFAGILHVTQADGRQTRVLTLKCYLALAQLRDVLTAENSTVVAKKSYNAGPIHPERPESNQIAIAIGQRNIGYSDCEGIGHARILRGWKSSVKFSGSYWPSLR